MYAGPVVTVNRLAPIAVTPFVVAVTSRIERNATGETVRPTVACVASVIVFVVAATPGPKSKVVARLNVVNDPITVTSFVSLCAALGGYTNSNDGVVNCTVKPLTIAAVSAWVVTITVR